MTQSKQRNQGKKGFLFSISLGCPSVYGIKANPTTETEQNLRLSQSERILDAANGRIPLLPPAIFNPSPSTETLPPDLQLLLARYRDPSTSRADRDSMRHVMGDLFAQYETVRSRQAADQAQQERQVKLAELRALQEELNQTPL